MSREEWYVRELKAGDHVRFRFNSFYHHGLYEGNGFVIHFAGPNMEHLVDPEHVVVRRDKLEDFANGRNIEVRKYSLIEKLTKKSSAKAIKQAQERIGETGYDILHNNCEHFVNSCVFGRAYSTQIDEMRKKLADG